MSSTSQQSTSISRNTSSNGSYNSSSHEAQTSPLAHPFGLALLEHYEDHVVPEAAKDVCEVAREDDVGQDVQRTARQESVAALADALYTELVVRAELNPASDSPLSDSHRASLDQLADTTPPCVAPALAAPPAPHLAPLVVSDDLAGPGPVAASVPSVTYSIENGKETDITTNLRDCLGQHLSSPEWKGTDAKSWTVTGENKIEGIVQGQHLKGKADAILHQGENPVCVIEASVESNGGVKKVGQGRNYCAEKAIPVLFLIAIDISRKPGKNRVRVVESFNVDVFLVIVEHDNGDSRGKSAFRSTFLLVKPRTWTWRKDGRQLVRVVARSPALCMLQSSSLN
jgi:hypothetical protein